MQNFTLLSLLFLSTICGIQAENISYLSPFGDTYGDGVYSETVFNTGQPDLIWIKIGSTDAYTRVESIKCDLKQLDSDRVDELLKTSTDVTPSGDSAKDIYYVDADDGSDEQDGLSAQTAWKSLEKVNVTTLGAGARILFKCGQSWTGTLRLKGSGEEDKPIVIGSYGAGDKPVLNGAGASETIHLNNMEYVELRNLEIHGVNSSKKNGGIFMKITGNLVPTYFNDLLIEGCLIRDVDRSGVYNVSTWEDRTMDVNENWTPTLNYNVRHNVFERTGANALVVRNRARFTKANIGDADGGGLDIDFRTKNTILQYNYMHDNDHGMLATGGGFDGFFNDNTIFRYNIIERDGLVARENGEKYAFKVSGQITNTTFHNNVVYLSPQQEGVDINPDGGQEGFKLRGNSPAIGAGRALIKSPAADFFGNPIPRTGPLDIGVNQYAADANANTPGGFAKSNFHVYLLIGQSNMAGRGDIGPLDEVVLDSIYLYNGTGWEKASAPLNKYSTVRKRLDLQKMNPAYTFARKLSEYTGKGIGLVVNARGGTSIKEWMKGYDGSTDMDLYEEAVARLKEAMKDGVFKGILWHQGESDQGSTTIYMEKLKQLVSDLRADLGENAFFVAGELGKWRDSSEDFNSVIQNISNDINRADYVSSDGLNPIDQDFGDPHFDGFSQRVLGGHYADKILEHVYNLEPGVASLYSKCDYRGYKVVLKPGIYPLDELEKRGIRDNDLSSITLEPGYQARLLKSRDDKNPVLIESSTACLESTAVANDVSYVIIEKIGTMGG